MKHPAFRVIAVITFFGVFVAVHGCIVVRQSGAHDTHITIQKSDNVGLSMAAHRENSSQDAKSDPKLDAKGDLKVPIVPGT